MNDSSEASASLTRHPKYPCAQVSHIQASALRIQDGTIKLNFILEGEVSKLSLPLASTSGWVHGLWEHSCFEAFIRPANEPRYCEFNFSPSGAWAAFAFQRYREGEAFGEALPPVLTSQRTPTRFELSAVLPPELLPGITAETPLRLGCCAVIEDEAGMLSYWALRHPREIADFHHPDSFTLQL